MSKIARIGNFGQVQSSFYKEKDVKDCQYWQKSLNYKLPIFAYEHTCSNLAPAHVHLIDRGEWLATRTASDRAVWSQKASNIVLDSNHRRKIILFRKII